MRTTAGLLLIVVGLLGASPALADNWKECASANNDKSIKGCSAVIKAGKGSKIGLASVYNKRGLAYFNKNDTEHAVADFKTAIKLDPKSLVALGNLGYVFEINGDYVAAEEIYRRAISVSEALHGVKHPITAKNLNNLARLLEVTGDHAAAELLFRRALTINEKSVRPDKGELGVSLNNLALLLAKKADYASAEPLYRRAIEINKKVFGPEHPETLSNLSNLALLLDEKGDHAAAKVLYRKVLVVREKVSGVNHPDTATSLNNLAVFLKQKGDYTAAETYHRRALAIREKVLGAEHPDTAISLGNLAALLRSQSDYAAAEPLYRRALAIMEKVRGPEHPDTATSLNGLAFLLDDKGDYAAAELLYRRTLRINEKVYGLEHPITADATNNLALLLHRRGDYAAAEPLYRRSLAIREKAFGEEHFATTASLNNLAGLLDEKGDYAAAEPLYRRALEINMKVRGPEHLDIASNLGNLAVLLDKKGDHAAAEPLYRRALELNEKILGAEHPDTARALSNLALLLANQGKYAEAELFYRRALAIREKVLGPEHPDTANTLDNYSSMVSDRGDYATAEVLLRRALAIREKTLGPEHADTALNLNNLAIVLEDKGELSEAESLIRRELAIDKKIFGPKSRTSLLPLVNLAHLLDSKGDYSGALIHYREAASFDFLEPTGYLKSLQHTFDVNDSIDQNGLIEESFNVVQRAAVSTASAALTQLSVRFAAGSDHLAAVVRKVQDLIVRQAQLNQMYFSEISKPLAKHDLSSIDLLRKELAEIIPKLESVKQTLRSDFPNYAELTDPRPLKISEIQTLLGEDEALLLTYIASDKVKEPSDYVWLVTKRTVVWRTLATTKGEIATIVKKLRITLDPDTKEDFDPKLANHLFDLVLGPVKEFFLDKKHLIFILNGPLTSLPPHVLVATKSTSANLKNADWLIRHHAITVLPSLSSLKILRTSSMVVTATAPIRGYADPIFFSSDLKTGMDATTSGYGAYFRSGTANLEVLRRSLPRLPETADELRAVANSLGAAAADVVLGVNATETAVKRSKLDNYRILYFATHGLLAGDVAEYAKLRAEPALALSIPKTASELDDGLLTSSEIARLKLNADWVVLSACNTAAGNEPGAEALSGLASAFFYAGARALVVSHWPVESQSAVRLMTTLFDVVSKNKHLRAAEALRLAMISVMQDRLHPEYSNPSYWAPFILVGEPRQW